MFRSPELMSAGSAEGPTAAPRRCCSQMVTHCPRTASANRRLCNGAEVLHMETYAEATLQVVMNDMLLRLVSIG